MPFALKKYPDAGPAPDMLSPVFMQDQPQPLVRLPQQAPPNVVQPNPQEQQIISDRAQLEKVRTAEARPWGFKGAEPSPEFPQGLAPNHPGTMGKIAHVLSVAGNIAGNIVAPGPMSLIPGTQLYNKDKEEDLTSKIAGEEKQQSEQALQGAQTELRMPTIRKDNESAEALTPATADEGKAFGVPEGTMLNAASRAALAKQAGHQPDQVSTTTETNQTKRDIADAATLSREKIAPLKPEQRDDRAIRLMEKPPEQRTQEENAYLGAYSKWVDQTKTQPGVQRMMALAQFRPAQVVNPDGSVSYDYMGHAIQTGANTPQSMNFRTATRLQAFMTSGKGGQTLTAYRTANDHLGLLEDAMQALNNGDVQLLNKLSNRFKAEFGVKRTHQL